MAFSSYSSLFKCGLLPEGSSPSFTTAPWATEYCGPRRGSLPFPSDRFSELSDFSAQLLEPFTTPGNENTTSDDALYFTFKKRNINEHRSFLSLDLAESQSMRSVSIKGKEPVSNAFESEQVSDSAVVSPTDVHNSFFSSMLSPLTSIPGSPQSAHSVPDPDCSSSTLLSPHPRRPVTMLHQPTPRQFDNLSPLDTQLGRELSPMLFAAPSPPLVPLHSHFDSFSSSSVRSPDVLSRTSTVSSSYKRAQRVDALKRLEGRGADGAVGRLKPRLSQNFMHLSDDEDEEAPAPMDTGIGVILEEVQGDQEAPLEHRRNSSQDRSRSRSRGRSLSISIKEEQWYTLTPRQTAWSVLFGGETDGDIDTEVDKIFGLDNSPYNSDSQESVNSYVSHRPKRSKLSDSPKSSYLEPLAPYKSSEYTFPSKKTKSPGKSVTHPIPANLHPLSPSSPSLSTSSPAARPLTLMPHSLWSPYLDPSSDIGVRQRTVSDSQTVKHESTKRTRRRHSRVRLPARLELHIDWKQPSFIDMRDESLESDSRTDSWHSLFEISCKA